jgi:hypothetical protein
VPLPRRVRPGQRRRPPQDGLRHRGSDNARLDEWLASLFHPEHLDETCAQLAQASGPDEAAEAKTEAALRTIVDCDRRLERYRKALDSGADPTVVTGWIAEAQGEKLTAERTLAEANPSRATKQDIRAMLADLGDIATALAEADPKLKARVYRETLGLRLVYKPDESKVLVTASPAPRVLENVSEGRSPLNAHGRALRGELILPR